MEKFEKALLIILTAFILLIVIGIIIFYGFGLNGYGINKLCSSVGGIWCYWPSWFGVFSTISSIMAITLTILIIFFLSKKLSVRKVKKSIH